MKKAPILLAWKGYMAEKFSHGLLEMKHLMPPEVVDVVSIFPANSLTVENKENLINPLRYKRLGDLTELTKQAKKISNCALWYETGYAPHASIARDLVNLVVRVLPDILIVETPAIKNVEVLVEAIKDLRAYYAKNHNNSLQLWLSLSGGSMNMCCASQKAFERELFKWEQLTQPAAIIFNPVLYPRAISLVQDMMSVEREYEWILENVDPQKKDNMSLIQSCRTRGFIKEMYPKKPQEIGTELANDKVFKSMRSYSALMLAAKLQKNCAVA